MSSMSSTPPTSSVPSGSEKTLPVALIPAYMPEPALPEIVSELVASGSFQAVLVVNDGSGPAQDALFTAVAALPGVQVLRHAVNLGKGAALKTGMNHAACHFPDSVGVVTLDADGQHAVPDVLAVAAALGEHPAHLVLGVRGFGSGVPLRSRFGNAVTRQALRMVTGQKITDTQTGLRGVPMAMVPELLRLASTGYEFELDMLLRCKYSNRPIHQVGIATIYIENNRSSHFNPLLDSMRIYFVLLRFAASSVITAVIDNLVFALVFSYWGHVAGSQVVGRTAGLLFNYFANKTVVFHSQARVGQSFPRYLLLCVVSGIISYSLLTFIHSVTGIGVVQAKIIAETVIFFFNFVIQRDFIFSGADRPGEAPA